MLVAPRTDEWIQRQARIRGQLERLYARLEAGSPEDAQAVARTVSPACEALEAALWRIMDQGPDGNP